MTPIPRTPRPRSAALLRDRPEAPDDAALSGVAEQPGPFWAKITGQAAGTNRYAWTQIDEGDTAAFDTGLSDGFAATGTSAVEGAPAYEVNGAHDVPVGTRVKLWPAGDLTYYVFAAPGVVTVEEVDGTPSYTGASTLRFDQADGFSLSQPAAGVVRVDLLPASPSQTGVVTPANQDFGSGIKTAGAWRSQLLTDFGTFGVGGVTGYSHASNVALISTVGGAGAGVDMTGAWVFGVGAIYIVPDGLTTYTGQTGTLGPGAQTTCGLVTSLGSGTFVTLSGNNTWTGTNAFTGAVTVHPATDVSPLVLQGGGAGAADILDLKTAGGATVLSVTGAGNVTLGGNLSVAGVLSGAAFTGLQVSNYRNFF